MVTTQDGLHLYAEQVGDAPESVVVPQRIYLREYFEHATGGLAAIFYDPRNRGLSETVADSAYLARGILHDAEDLEAVRSHFGFERMAILTHSYMGVAALLYAAAHPERVARMVLLGPPPPDPMKVYPPILRSSDGTSERFNEELTNLRIRTAALAPTVRCRETWELLRRLYVADPVNSSLLHWDPCDLPNEANFMLPFMKYIMPSLAAVRMSDETLSRISTPILIVHGKRDRSAPFGGALEWGQLLPNARLIIVEEAAHVPWIEDPQTVYGAIRTFLAGTWPSGAKSNRAQ